MDCCMVHTTRSNVRVMNIAFIIVCHIVHGITGFAWSGKRKVLLASIVEHFKCLLPTYLMHFGSIAYQVQASLEC